jgi:branched-chain amino acid aminotransferase
MTASHDAKGALSAPQVQQLNASLLRTTLLPADKQEPVPAADDPVRRTQSCTTSHMLVANWSQEEGWATPEIVPYGNFSLPPTASVLHYGTECFVSLTASGSTKTTG